MAQALYRKYRSKTLDEVVGQSHITSLLKNAISSGRISHAYLLTGPRGVGKTSIARILAHEINHLPYTEESNHLDIIEIDAASNNGVEDVRDLRDKVMVAPVSAAKKVYIIDEVHMLSKQAFNALLKTLEEPPEHVVFILATTDVEKLPATIISRTQRYSFRPINDQDMISHLRTIAGKEKIVIDDAALHIIAKRSDGSFRDSISLLEQLSHIPTDKTGVTGELVESILGMAPTSLIQSLFTAVSGHDLETVVSLLSKADQNGTSSVLIAAQLIDQLRQDIVKQPQLIQLLDDLLDVSRSSHPDIKLLTTLARHTGTPPQKNIALSHHTKTVAARPADLMKPPIKPVAQKPAPSRPSLSKETPVAPLPVISKAAVTPLDIGQFSWDNLIEYIRKNHVAVYSVLVKCKHELTDGTLVIYTMNNFYKKKLDDTRYSSLITASLGELGFKGLEMDTIASAPAPKDSQAAAVAAIMGGGEEVSLEAL
ncbi:MAG: dnaX [Candidatus Saccharibacteria bacterium]|nr:dnaX [Candidatus Saccharibacteria bacterium]